MNAPCYQIVKLQSHDPRIIHGQILNFNFTSSPVVISMEHLGQHQLDCLNTIEKFYLKYGFPKLPYSIYIIADCPEYEGPLFIVNDKSSLPQFFNKKERTLNSKESNFLNKIKLKQENFKSLVAKEYMNSIKAYSLGHRDISQKQNFLVYLEKINKGLREYYGKKE